MGNVSIVCGDYRNTLQDIVSRIQPPAMNLCKIQKNEVRRISFCGNYTSELIFPMNCSTALFVANVSGVTCTVCQICQNILPFITDVLVFMAPRANACE